MRFTLNSKLLELNLATILLSTSGVLGKLIDLNPFYAIFWRCLLAFAFLMLFIRGRGKSLKVDWKAHRWFFIISGALLGLHWGTYFWAIQLSSVAVAFISIFTFPVITTLLEPVFFGNKLLWGHIASGVLVLIGVAWLMPGFDLSNNITAGVAVGLFSSLLFSIRNLMNKRMIGTYSSLTIMNWQLLMAAFALLPFLFWVDLSLSLGDVGWLVVLALVTTAIGQTLFVGSLRHFTTSTASLITSSQPVFGILWAVLFVGEKLNMNVVIGGTIILLAVVAENVKALLDSTSKA